MAGIWSLVLVALVAGLHAATAACPSDSIDLVFGAQHSAITASSFYSAKHTPSNGRLNSGSSSTSAGAWCAKNNKAGEWIQVRLAKGSTVCAIQTQGRDSRHKQWVTKFNILTSTDCSTFTPLQENGKPKVFSGNVDANTVVTRALPEAVQALCVRVKILAYSRHPCMRFELQGIEACMKERLAALEDQVRVLKDQVGILKAKTEVKQSAFTATATVGTQSLRMGAHIKFEKVLFNLGNNYDPRTSTFTCPVNGLYLFHVSPTGGSTTHLGVYIVKNSVPIVKTHARKDLQNGAVTAFTQCRRGQRVWVTIVHPSHKAMYGGEWSNFSGALLHQL